MTPRSRGRWFNPICAGTDPDVAIATTEGIETPKRGPKDLEMMEIDRTGTGIARIEKGAFDPALETRTADIWMSGQ